MYTIMQEHDSKPTGKTKSDNPGTRDFMLYALDSDGKDCDNKRC